MHSVSTKYAHALWRMGFLPLVRAGGTISSMAESNVTDGDGMAIYVHFPFCRRRCSYCDFDTFAGQEEHIDRYLDALVRQIFQSPPVRATSLYVGGGTPSLMRPDQVVRVVEAYLERFDPLPDAEATIEANPSDLSVDVLEGFRKVGFNRLSLGVQSTDPDMLRLLGRRHGHEDAAAAVEAAGAAGFDNLSVDLIYGVPTQELSTWRATLLEAVKWDVQHVSCYMLTLEPDTPLERAVEQGLLVSPADELVVEMYRLAGDLLGEAGYSRYEISNWAQPGRECAHNLTYWRNGEYLGIGAGAAGFLQGRRYKIAPDITRFLAGAAEGRLDLVEDEEIHRQRAMSDGLILGLRLEEGVSREGFLRCHGMWPEDAFGGALNWAEERGLLERDEERLKLTEQGILLSNELFARLV